MTMNQNYMHWIAVVACGILACSCNPHEFVGKAKVYIDLKTYSKEGYHFKLYSL